LLALFFTLQGYSSKLLINNNKRPLYITTARGLTVIDTKTDKLIAKELEPNYPDSIAAFYKTFLFTEYSGTDFPVNISPATHLFDLKTGKKEKIVENQLSFLRKEGTFLYGMSSDYDLLFIYDTFKRKFKKFESSDLKSPPKFVGIVSLKNRQKAVVLSGGIKSLDGRKVLLRETISASLIADSDKLIFIGGKIVIQDLRTGKERVLDIKFPGDPIVFYAHGKLYIGESTGTEDKPKLSTYKVYRLTNGKLIKTLKMDIRDYNVLKINDLLIFLTGPHKGYALNLKTSEIEKTDITEQSVVQDGKIYSVVKDRLVIRRGERILKAMKLDSQFQKPWDDDISIYNRAIFSSQPTNDNFKIMDGFL
jgi:hypothetical protein